MQPLFIFSLPRSGSTLLQRILASHEDIATVSEPWILLPYVYTLRRQGTYSEYSHNELVRAIEDFCNELPGGQEDYLAEIRTFTLRLYEKVTTNNAKYFLDKTPRYHLIIEEIINLFPEGKFIFLWRNPLSIIASIMNTWGDGKWNLFYHKVDIFDGLINMVAAYDKYQKQVYTINYEDLLNSPETELQGLFNYLKLPLNSEILMNFRHIELKGRYGDPTGVHQYKSISNKSIDKWKQTLTNPVRKAWCKNYLKWVGQERLTAMSYSLQELLSELDSVPFSLKHVGSDLLNIGFGATYNMLGLTILKHKIQTLPDWRKIHFHN